MSSTERPVYSPDGQYLWSGSEWLPAPPSPASAAVPVQWADASVTAVDRRSGHRRWPPRALLLGSFAAVMVAAGIFFALGATPSSSSNTGSALQVTATPGTKKGGDCFIYQTDSGCQYKVVVTNAGRQPLTVRSSDFRLLDASGREYSVDEYSSDKYLDDGVTLQPGQSTEPMFITFDVAPNTHVSSLTYPGGRQTVASAWSASGT